MTTTIEERNAAVAATANDALPDEALQDVPQFTQEEIDALVMRGEEARRERETQNEVDRERHVLAQIVSDINVRKGYHGDDETSIVIALSGSSTRYASGNIFTYGNRMYSISVSEQKIYGFEVQSMAQELADRNGHRAEMLNANDLRVGSVGFCEQCEALLRLSVRHGANDEILRWCPNSDRDEDDKPF